MSRAWAAGSGPKISVDQRERLRLVELAGDHEVGVVRLVVLPVERLQPLDRHVLDVGPRADRALPVVVPEVRRRQHALARARPSGSFSPVSNSLRTTVNSLSRSFLAMKELTIRSASSSSAQSQVLVGGRERLEVVRAVVPGRPVGPRAVRGELLRDVGVLRRALEHQVLEQVRHPGLAVVSRGASRPCR